MSSSSSSASPATQLTVLNWRLVATFLQDEELFNFAFVSALTFEAVDSDYVWRPIAREAEALVVCQEPRPPQNRRNNNNNNRHRRFSDSSSSSSSSSDGSTSDYEDHWNGHHAHARRRAGRQIRGAFNNQNNQAMRREASDYRNALNNFMDATGREYIVRDRDSASCFSRELSTAHKEGELGPVIETLMAHAAGPLLASTEFRRYLTWRLLAMSDLALRTQFCFNSTLGAGVPEKALVPVDVQQNRQRRPTTAPAAGAAAAASNNGDDDDDECASPSCSSSPASTAERQEQLAQQARENAPVPADTPREYLRRLYSVFGGDCDWRSPIVGQWVLGGTVDYVRYILAPQWRRMEGIPTESEMHRHNNPENYIIAQARRRRRNNMNPPSPTAADTISNNSNNLVEAALKKRRCRNPWLARPCRVLAQSTRDLLDLAEHNLELSLVPIIQLGICGFLIVVVLALVTVVDGAIWFAWPWVVSPLVLRIKSTAAVVANTTRSVVLMPEAVSNPAVAAVAGLVFEQLLGPLESLSLAGIRALIFGNDAGGSSSSSSSSSSSWFSNATSSALSYLGEKWTNFTASNTTAAAGNSWPRIEWNETLFYRSWNFPDLLAPTVSPVTPPDDNFVVGWGSSSSSSNKFSIFGIVGLGAAVVGVSLLLRPRVRAWVSNAAAHDYFAAVRPPVVVEEEQYKKKHLQDDDADEAEDQKQLSIAKERRAAALNRLFSCRPSPTLKLTIAAFVASAVVSTVGLSVVGFVDVVSYFPRRLPPEYWLTSHENVADWESSSYWLIPWSWRRINGWMWSVLVNEGGGNTMCEATATNGGWARFNLVSIFNFQCFMWFLAALVPSAVRAYNNYESLCPIDYWLPPRDDDATRRRIAQEEEEEKSPEQVRRIGRLAILKRQAWRNAAHLSQASVPLRLGAAALLNHVFVKDCVVLLRELGEWVVWGTLMLAVRWRCYRSGYGFIAATLAAVWVRVFGVLLGVAVAWNSGE